MLKRLMILGGMLAMLLVVAAPAMAQADKYRHSGTGVLGEPYTVGQDPTTLHQLTEEETGTVYELSSGFVELGDYVGERVTFEGQQVPGLEPGSNDPIPVNVTDIEQAAGSDTEPYVETPDAIITGVIGTTTDPRAEGPVYIITEDGTGDEYGIFSNLQDDGVDLSQYVGQQVTITGYFQTEGTGTAGYVLTDLLIYVESVEVLDSAPATDDQYQDEGTADKEPATDEADEVAVGDETPATDDQYEVADTVSETPTSDSAADESSSEGSVLSVLPDTGGFSLAALGAAAALLLGGGLLARSSLRR